MRKSCMDCVRKHLGSAGIFLKETKMGYPDYDIWVIGELEHAADECLLENPELAGLIREHRLAWTENRMHVIPFEGINRYMKNCSAAENSGMSYPEIPIDLLDGLDTDEGKLVVHGDTRP